MLRSKVLIVHSPNITPQEAEQLIYGGGAVEFYTPQELLDVLFTNQSTNEKK